MKLRFKISPWNMFGSRVQALESTFSFFSGDGKICKFLAHFLFGGGEKSARTVGAKGRVFPEALTQSALAGGGGPLFLQVKCMVLS